MDIRIENNKIWAPLKNKWLVLTPEEKVRQEYIERLKDNYGYSYEQMVDYNSRLLADPAEKERDRLKEILKGMSKEELLKLIGEK